MKDRVLTEAAMQQDLPGLCSWCDNFLFEYMSVPSLKLLMSRKVAIMYLLYNTDVQKIWINIFYKSKVKMHEGEDLALLSQMRNDLELKMSNVSIPACKSICLCAKILQNEIYEWLMLHNMKNAPENVIKIFLTNIVWTIHGLINKGKTLRLLFETNLSAFYKYWVACMYMWKKEVYNYWDEMSKDERFYMMTDLVVSDEIPNDVLMIYWACRANDNFSHLDRQLKARTEQERYLILLDSIVQNPNQNYVAALYFWNKLYEREQKHYLFFFATTALRGHNPNIFCYFVSVMNEHEIGLFFFCTRGILTSLSHHGLLFPIAVIISSFLASHDHSGLSTCLKTLSTKLFFQFDNDHNPDRIPLIFSWEMTPICFYPKFVCDFNQIVDYRGSLDTFFDFCSARDEVEVELRARLVRRREGDFVSIVSKSSDIEADLRFIDEVLDWYFLQEEGYENFKNLIAEDYILQSSTILLNSWNLEADLKRQEIFLYWSLSSMVKVIKANHDIACQIVSFAISWMVRAKFTMKVETYIEKVDTVIAWCYVKDNAIQEMKRTTITEQVNNIAKVLMSSTKINTHLQRTNIILNWCLPSELEISEYKEQVIKSQLHKIKSSLSVKKLESEEHRRASAILNWCYSTPEEMEESKAMTDRLERLRKLKRSYLSRRGAQIRQAFSAALKKITK